MIDQFGWDIIEFVLVWKPYGGPRDEETIPRFGLDAHRLSQRFEELVQQLITDEKSSLTVHQHKLLRRVRECSPMDGVAKTAQHPPTSNLRCEADALAAGGDWVNRGGIWHWNDARSS